MVSPLAAVRQLVAGPAGRPTSRHLATPQDRRECYLELYEGLLLDAAAVEDIVREGPQSPYLAGWRPPLHDRLADLRGQASPEVVRATRRAYRALVSWCRSARAAEVDEQDRRACAYRTAEDALLHAISGDLRTDAMGTWTAA